MSDDECTWKEIPWAECTSILTRIPEGIGDPVILENIDPKADELLEKGIKLMEEDKNEEAIGVFTEALEIEKQHALVFLNRGCCHARLKNFVDALDDFEMAVELRKDWPMAFFKKGTVCLELYRHRHAHVAFTRGYDMEPTNEKLGKGQFEALRRLQLRNDSPYPRIPIPPLSDKTVQMELRKNKKTKHLMDDPGFPEIIEEIRKNPKAMSKYSGQGDYKVATCVAAARSLDVNKGEIDYMDLVDPEEHKKLVERWGGYPWVPDYSPVKEIYIPPPPPPKKEEKKPSFPLFELGMDSCMPSDCFYKPDMNYLKRNRLANYELNLKEDFDLRLSSFKY